jgi:hypothetical protein
MANLYQKRYVVDKKYYKVPDYIKRDFSDIPGQEILVQEGDRLDILAEQIYSDASYWKYIALYNDIGYFFDLVPGQIIKIPNDIQKVIERS